MPDIPNRDELEAELARRFSKLSSKHRRELLQLLGTPPNYGNVPASFWERVAGELNGSFVPFLTLVFLESIERLLPTVPIGIDWALANQYAANWAREYSFELIRGINNTSRRAVQDAVASYFEQGLTRADLETRLASIFGPTRAEMIAVTETTRASVAGERAWAEELRKQGVEMIEVWETHKDDLVCPICAPLDGKPKGEAWTDATGPPAHVRCRCWTNHEIKKP